MTKRQMVETAAMSVIRHRPISPEKCHLSFESDSVFLSLMQKEV
jgi:hypothetical protein